MRIKLFIGVLFFFHCINLWSMNIELIETSVKSPSDLHQDEALYVLIHYQSDQPVRFQAIGEYQNQPINKNVRLNPSQPYPAGNGQAIAWVAYYQSAKIDHITVTVYNKNWHSLKKVSLPVAIEWSDTGVTHPLPPWVQKLNQQQQAYVASAYKNSPAESVGWALFFPLLMLSAPVYWILQIRVLITWKDMWRKYALLPLCISLPLLFYTLFALLAGSNLWPLMMIFISPALLIFLLIIILCKRSTRILNT